MVSCADNFYTDLQMSAPKKSQYHQLPQMVLTSSLRAKSLAATSSRFDVAMRKALEYAHPATITRRGPMRGALPAGGNRKMRELMKSRFVKVAI